MHTLVDGHGDTHAKLVIVGEAPGADEEQTGIPFVGQSGALLDEALESAGIRRSDCYLTNVVKVRPPHNDISQLPLIGRTLEEFLPGLYEEIKVIQPNCILAVGNTALTALTGFKGIQKYRGSILYSSAVNCKVVPCLHPALLLHKEIAWKEFAWIKFDIARAGEQSQFPEYRLPPRNLHIALNSLDVVRFLERAEGAPFVTLDVETHKTWAQCIGLAYDSTEAISIPTFWDQIPLHDLAYIWKVIAEFLADTKVKIVAQNAKFDQKRCRQLGLDWHSCWFSMDMGWHVLYPEFPKKLQFISSILTEEPYYKDEGGEYNPKIHKIDRWFMYNAKDAVVEYECTEKILALLLDTKLYSFYFDKIQPLYELYYDIEDVGILVDREVRKHLGNKYESLRNRLQVELVKNIADGDPFIEEAYKNFNVMSNGPKNQVAKLLFGHLKLPIREDTGDRTLKALCNNVVKKQRIKDILMGILNVRGVRKTIGTYVNASLSEGEPWIGTVGRIHTTCNLNGTESGRTSTGIVQSPVSVNKMGIALQTMTKHEDPNLSKGGGDLRSMFIADEGFTLVEIDQSQAEDRVVCVLAKDWDALEAYKKTVFKKNIHGCKDDRHTLTTMAVLSLSFDEVTDEKRQIGKKTTHGGNYDMGKHEFMEFLGGAGIFMSEWKCNVVLEAFHAARPKVRGVFHQEIQTQLRLNECILVSPHGRRRQFFNKWGRDLWKEAYAQIPQATVSDQTKFAMLQGRRRIPGYLKDWFFLLESHDSALALVRDELVPEYIKVMTEEFERPIDFKNCTLSRDYKLVIPAETVVGKRWIGQSEEWPDGMRKWK
jgi:uracil-DNA glycosylase family 4